MNELISCGRKQGFSKGGTRRNQNYEDKFVKVFRPIRFQRKILSDFIRISHDAKKRRFSGINGQQTSMDKSKFVLKGDLCCQISLFNFNFDTPKHFSLLFSKKLKTLRIKHKTKTIFYPSTLVRIFDEGLIVIR
jgi:hypothetical protein